MLVVIREITPTPGEVENSGLSGAPNWTITFRVEYDHDPIWPPHPPDQTSWLGTSPMNFELPQSDLEMLSTELVDNAGCRDLVVPLNDMENLIFGPDFACNTRQIQPWVESGCLFYAAVTGEAVAGHRRILSALSVFVTTADSRDRMLLGEIADYEMAPWTPWQGGQPTIYLSSVVSVAPHHLAAMYNSLVRDVMYFREAHGLTFHGGFAIATGTAGRHHMAKSGFRTLEGYKYRGAYDLMVIDAYTATTAFWTSLLHDDTTFLRRADANQAVVASTLPAEGRPLLNNSHPERIRNPLAPEETAAAQQVSDTDSAREVEKRLALSKLKRLQGK